MVPPESTGSDHAAKRTLNPFQARADPAREIYVRLFKKASAHAEATWDRQHVP